MPVDQKLERILPRVQKPARYVDKPIGLTRKMVTSIVNKYLEGVNKQ